jgi:phosphoglycerate dehydrogenase-like enzyme
MKTAPARASFRIGLSADFLDDQRNLIFPDIGLSLLDGIPGLSHEFLREYKPEYEPEQLAVYDAVISLKPRVTAKSLAQATRLTVIARCGVGYDNVDLEACTTNDIAVVITPGAVMRPVAQSIVALVLAVSHNLVWKDRMLRRGLWAESARKLGKEPRGRIVGTIGLGNIASEAVRLLRPFGVSRFLAYDPFITADIARESGVDLVSLDELLASSDFVLVNCPLNQNTRKLLGERELGLMKPDAVLINTARGGIVDQQALIAALESGRIRAAALDVFEREPIEPDSPLLRMENTILTAHSLAWTEELFRDMGAADCEAALAVWRGEAPANAVNKEVLDRPGFLKKLEHYRTAHQEVTR